MGTAVDDGPLTANPVRIRGAGVAKRVMQIRRASLDKLAALVDALPPRYRILALLAAWCGLRFGELTELRRSDLDYAHGKLRVWHAVVTMPGGRQIVGEPKIDAGIRDVAIPSADHSAAVSRSTLTTQGCGPTRGACRAGRLCTGGPGSVS
jgi:integrase